VEWGCQQNCHGFEAESLFVGIIMDFVHKEENIVSFRNKIF